MNRNYQKELEKVIQVLQGEHKSLLLHSCCAPCSSYVLSYLRSYFDITLFYYNPNITDEREYRKRVVEQQRLIMELNQNGKSEAADGSNTYAASIQFMEGTYQPEKFYEIAKGLEMCPEGGERCFRCYELRLREAAEVAREGGFDYFTTTLTISPLKNAEKLNEIGERISKEYGVAFLPSDFKKKNGYKRSIEFSKEYDLYRQDFCGCAYSKAERERQKHILEVENS